MQLVLPSYRSTGKRVYLCWDQCSGSMEVLKQQMVNADKYVKLLLSLLERISIDVLWFTGLLILVGDILGGNDELISCEVDVVFATFMLFVCIGKELHFDLLVSELFTAYLLCASLWTVTTGAHSSCEESDMVCLLAQLSLLSLQVLVWFHEMLILLGECIFTSCVVNGVWYSVAKREVGIAKLRHITHYCGNGLRYSLCASKQVVYEWGWCM